MATTTRPAAPTDLPQAALPPERMQGHWLLARLGKRVLRPGGAELTRRLLDAAHVAGSDVVEFAPGLGWTAQQLLDRGPASYVGVERDEAAARTVTAIVEGRGAVRLGDVTDSGLDDAHADLVVGEAMLTMQVDEHKRAIAREAARILRPGGRYAIHELGLAPDDIGEDVKRDLQRSLARAIQVNARPLTVLEWTAVLADAGLVVEEVLTAPMALLEPRRLVADEGLLGALRFVTRVLIHRSMRRRVLTMRRTFARHRDHLTAVGIIARKPG